MGTTPAWKRLISIPRFTPTCVGTDFSLRGPAHSRKSVHPHVRGDNHRRACDFVSSRFTPTCVGTTRSERRALPSSGSPPRAWGQRGFRSQPRRKFRFTPTCVGTTSPSHDRAARRRFTPTCVGTTSKCGAVPLLPCGSPPRAWGQQVNRLCPSRIARFTPTCVGTTIRIVTDCQRSRRFTPTCVGTTYMKPLIDVKFSGSPPRAWGQHFRFQHMPRWRPVHPHVRGDN